MLFVQYFSLYSVVFDLYSMCLMCSICKMINIIWLSTFLIIAIIQDQVNELIFGRFAVERAEIISKKIFWVNTNSEQIIIFGAFLAYKCKFNFLRSFRLFLLQNAYFIIIILFYIDMQKVLVLKLICQMREIGKCF